MNKIVEVESEHLLEVLKTIRDNLPKGVNQGGKNMCRYKDEDGTCGVLPDNEKCERDEPTFEFCGYVPELEELPEYKKTVKKP